MQGYVDKHEEWQLLQDRSLDYKQKISTATDSSMRVLFTLWLSIGAIIFTALVYFTNNLFLAAFISFYLLALIFVIYAQLDFKFDFDGTAKLFAKKDVIDAKIKSLPNPELADSENSFTFTKTPNSIGQHYIKNGYLHQILRRRFASFIVDLLAVYAFSAALGIILIVLKSDIPWFDFRFFEDISAKEYRTGAAKNIFWVYIVYYWYFISRSKQATIGMRLFSIKVEAFNGKEKYNVISKTGIILYPLGVLLSLQLAFPTILTILSTKFYRLPHDKFLGTTVMRSDVKITPTEI